jgi:glycosyltransferase involved in cell wall biosynthesis
MPSAQRVAIVVQRCHESVLGGSEALAWHYATLLRGIAEVEVLTTTASDYVTWRNDLPPGEAERDGIKIRRFPVVGERSLYWHELNGRLSDEFLAARESGGRARPWRPALQEEYIRKQGPWCPALGDHLAMHQGGYHKVVLFTYLYPTTYFSARILPSSRSVLVPTLHDEPAASLDCFSRVYGKVGEIVWNAEQERELAARIWGIDRGTTLGMAVVLPAAEPEAPGFPYILYCGRIDAHKGCETLFADFLEYKGAHPGPLKLALTGSLKCQLPDSGDVVYLGFVPEQRKFDLMKGALAFVMPSAFESLSIVTLEAMGLGTPVLASRKSAVVAAHVDASGCGSCYGGRREFLDMLDALVHLPGESREGMARAGRKYVSDAYSLERVRGRLAEILGLSQARAEAQ